MVKEFTRGPWVAVDMTDIIEPDYRRPGVTYWKVAPEWDITQAICTISTCQEGDMEETARLIARAPYLLWLVQKLLRELDNLGQMTRIVNDILTATWPVTEIRDPDTGYINPKALERLTHRKPDPLGIAFINPNGITKLELTSEDIADEKKSETT